MSNRLPPSDRLLLAAVEQGLTDPEFQPGAPIIMAEIFQLQPRDKWQFSVDVVRKPDGTMVAVLTDARGSIIENVGTSAEKLMIIAKMLEESVSGLRASAQSVK